VYNKNTLKLLNANLVYQFKKKEGCEEWVTVSFGGYVARQFIANWENIFEGVITNHQKQIWTCFSSFYDDLNDTDGSKTAQMDPSIVAKKGKKMELLLCVEFPNYKPNIYLHLFAAHAKEYYDF